MRRKANHADRGERDPATSTIIEGEWDQVMPLVKQCLDDLRRTVPRVVGLIKIDDEAGATGAGAK